ncbi:TPA: hypothetical protein MAF88_000005 [Klebsiella pneumoniae]|uniref:hypothetical protein n=1 Tax=Klebsiella pneumoniae TaxID=573 RepID=UPI00259D4867|nr:hypothetical protein [Klebsiella pneumoniae]ELA2799594.1 hypothetical protein [Klebsiella pneumoniae]HBS2886672.1 hypothetical protein [Klebsiella pneumoniae]HBS2928201.1 hypothetical protein [Klebsiella pneumoniae]HBS2973203.1 hypothetical protein [Klebsiella pneumoniae]
MIRRLCCWVLFVVLLLVAWRLASVLVDMVLLVIIVVALVALVALVACRRWPSKRKA